MVVVARLQGTPIDPTRIGLGSSTANHSMVGGRMCKRVEGS